MRCRCPLSRTLIILLVLAGCGGGSGGGDHTPQPAVTATPAATLPVATPTPSLAAGALDPAFGTGGTVLLPLQADVRIPRYGLRVLADGVVEVLVLARDTAIASLQILRVFPDGIRVESEVLAPGLEVEDAAFGSDGTLWVAGHPDSTERIARFSRESGVFAEESRARVALSTIAELVPLDDGGMLVVGQARDSAGLQRFDARGVADPTFGTNPFLVDGLVLGPPRESEVSIMFGGATVADDGRILVAGTHLEAFVFLAVVLAYDDHGALDPSFGTNGTVTFGSLGGSHVIAAAADGSAVVALERGGVERLERTGAVDAEYRARADVRGVGGGALTFAADGELVSVGGGFGPRYVLTVARIAPDGSPDSRFGKEGVVTTEIDASHRAQGTGFTTLALTPPGRITAAGIACRQPFVCDVVVARYRDVAD